MQQRRWNHISQNSDDGDDDDDDDDAPQALKRITRVTRASGKEKRKENGAWGDITQHYATDTVCCIQELTDCNLQVKTENAGQAYSQYSVIKN